MLSEKVLSKQLTNTATKGNMSKYRAIQQQNNLYANEGLLYTYIFYGDSYY